METLTEIRQQEIEKQERARRYESLLNSHLSLQATITRLEAIDAFQKAITALMLIFETCGDVPREVVTRGIQEMAWWIPAGMVARDVLMNVSKDALHVATRKEAERVSDLAKALNALNEVERQLRDDFNE